MFLMFILNCRVEVEFTQDLGVRQRVLYIRECFIISPDTTFTVGTITYIEHYEAYIEINCKTHAQI